MIPIMNEKKYVEDLMELSKLPSEVSPNRMITLLTKYYYSSERNEQEVVDLVCSAMEKYNLKIEYYQDYLARNRIKRVFSSICNGRTPLLKESDNIPLYQSEFNNIMSCSTDRERKILFVLYIIARHTDKYGWVYLPDSDIYKLANVSKTSKNQPNIFYNLLQAKKIKFTKRVDDLKVGVELSDGQEPIVLEIKEFKHMGNQLISFVREEYKMCEECGKLVKKTNNKKKYCKKCACEKEVARKREYARKHRGKHRETTFCSETANS